MIVLTREQIEKRIDELARKYVETHDKEIIEELYELACELGKMLKESSD
jgi:histone H3/H4